MTASTTRDIPVVKLNLGPKTPSLPIPESVEQKTPVSAPDSWPRDGEGGDISLSLEDFKAPVDPDDKPLIDPEKTTTSSKTTGPKTTAPDKDEWLDFFSRIILKYGTEFYADFVFRGVDPEAIAARDIERIRLRKDERDAIARPLAEYFAKSTWGKKHGRKVVALSGSVESMVVMGIWMRRVNRIAKKYRPKKQSPVRLVHKHERETQAEGQGNVNFGVPESTGNGTGNYGPTIINPGTG